MLYWMYKFGSDVVVGPIPDLLSKQVLDLFASLALWCLTAFVVALIVCLVMMQEGGI